MRYDVRCGAKATKQPSLADWGLARMVKGQLVPPIASLMIARAYPVLHK